MGLQTPVPQASPWSSPKAQGSRWCPLGHSECVLMDTCGKHCFARLHSSLYICQHCSDQSFQNHTRSVLHLDHIPPSTFDVLFLREGLVTKH